MIEQVCVNCDNPKSQTSHEWCRPPNKKYTYAHTWICAVHRINICAHEEPRRPLLLSKDDAEYLLNLVPHGNGVLRQRIEVVQIDINADFAKLLALDLNQILIVNKDE